MILLAGATHGSVSASAKTGFPGATATDIVLFTLTGPSVPVCVLVLTMPTATLQTVPAPAPQGGWARTARYPVKRANMAKTVNTTVTARTEQSVIPLLGNVIVLQAGLEYFVTQGVRQGSLAVSARRNVTVLMEGLVTT